MSTVSTFQFDKYFLDSHPERLMELANFYATIWMFDPNFREYKQCPNVNCRKYYSYDEVEIQGIHVCHGTTEQPHMVEFLDDAWNPEEVAADILKLTEMGDEFFGAMCIDNISGKIVGFTWGFVRSIESISESWGASIANKINAPEGFVTYYSEIATDPNYRKFGLGSELCKMLTGWMKTNHPNLPSLLRTHQNSPAFRLFNKVGYRKFADDTMYGGGRVMMKANSGEELHPEDLP